MPTPAAPADTRARLLAAATELFAERGFHATSVRDIAERAGANLAAGNYHYGSKKALYLEVLRAQFSETRALLTKREGVLPAGDLRKVPRARLVGFLEARIAAMLELLVGPPPGVHGTLMQREMTDPSEALPVIVEEFIRPLKQKLEGVIAALAPALDSETVEDCAKSVIGQILFHRNCMPVLLTFLGRKEFPRDYARRVADHIARFSLGGIAATAARKGKRHAS